MIRNGYPSDEEWAFAAPYLTLMKEDAPQRSHDLRKVFNGLRWLVEPVIAVAKMIIKYRLEKVHQQNNVVFS